MLSKQIHDLLEELAKKTFPDKEILKFFIEYVPKELRSKNGDYDSKTRKMRIFNLSRKPEHILSTSIHELAHHCEQSIYGDTGHSKRFYWVYKQLLETAVKMGVLANENIRNMVDKRDIKTLEKHCGRINATYQPEMNTKKESYIIKISNSYQIREILKLHSYKYHSIEQAWCKEVSHADLQNELQILSKLTTAESIEVVSANQITIDALYYVIVDNGFKSKDLLKENGYIFKGYNQKGNVWVKKLKASKLNEEKEFLSAIPEVEIKIKGIQ